ncbi:LPS export ABC transporter permease LptF [Legionella longbeachae]|uniref:Lipopolysaccharide export system permease protein LptF n=1 Tax=Legionella longbeachae serogroup 1 (strain NSW150) TaxID=661367 RepID=D3HPD9_LEGLN|nr:LPS export ABC transporter permease LptF [Legionella longbeachae]HBD7398285.1 LPS export ABC transporter permease LptF [Legionella pneumophila]ARB92356.1 LPS export ABC transporter permease LptF [Legionella longbeachae]ARM34463.1 LPS export ABC transporter permease LptF [Legionella longbeachae]EEZ96246.1 putative permease [Legionella longbeachae D-4968]QEY50408.1 LPS export ABC transporter permease LptF [Legionella longbeachae]
MIIFRYLAKEVLITLISLTSILVLIFLSNQLIQYLNRAASGSIPGVIIMKLMMLELPTLLCLLIPLGFYIAMLLAYGRLYAESEMTVLRACGYGPNKLLKHSLIMATVVGFIVAIVMIWGSPLIYIERAKLLRSTGIQTLVQTIMPGRFHAINEGKEVFYVQSMSRDHTKAEQVFLAKRTTVDDKTRWDVLWADQAFAETDPKTGEDYIILQNGKEYQGVPGHADYQIAEFGEYKARLPHPVVKISEDFRTISTANLFPFNNTDRAKAAELQWRFSVPIMVFALTLIAVPLSRINPRSGKFAKLLPAIIIYIVYANLLFIARDAMVSGKMPQWLGLWWVHLCIIAFGLWLIWRNQAKLA